MRLWLVTAIGNQCLVTKSGMLDSVATFPVTNASVTLLQTRNFTDTGVDTSALDTNSAWPVLPQHQKKNRHLAGQGGSSTKLS